MEKVKIKNIVFFIAIISLFSCNYDLDQAKKLSKVQKYKNSYGEIYFSVKIRGHDYMHGFSRWNEVKQFKMKDSAIIFRNEILEKDLYRIKSEFK